MKILILFFYLVGSVGMAKEPCKQNEHWVKPFFRKSYIRSDGTIVSSANVTGHCRESSKSFLFWKDRFQNSQPNSWPYTENFKAWAVNEKEHFLETIESLPEILNLEAVKGIYRATKSKDYPNPATSAEGIIVLYDTAFAKHQNLGRIVAHELAHQIYRNFSAKEKEDYSYATNWIPVSLKGSKFVSRKEGFVQDDGRDSPEEDFANNIEYQIFEPKTLEKITPQATRWIKNRFGDSLKIRSARK